MSLLAGATLGRDGVGTTKPNASAPVSTTTSRTKCSRRFFESKMIRARSRDRLGNSSMDVAGCSSMQARADCSINANVTNAALASQNNRRPRIASSIHSRVVTVEQRTLRFTPNPSCHRRKPSCLFACRSGKSRSSQVVRSAAATLSVALIACATPQRASQSVPTAEPRTLSAAERVALALRRKNFPGWPLVAFTSAYVSQQQAFLEPPRAGTVLISDDPMPSSALSQPFYAALERGTLLRGILSCFVIGRGSPSFVSADFVLSEKPQLLRGTKPVSSADDCFATRVGEMQLPFVYDAHLRLTARLRTMSHAAPWRSDAEGDLPRDLDAQIAVLDKLVDSTDTAHRSAARRLLATRHVDASLVSTDAAASAAHLARAEALFVSLAAQDVSARPAALFGLASALGYANEHARAQTPLRELVCPSLYPFTPGPPPALPGALANDHPPEYWRAWKRRYAPEPAAKGSAETQATAPGNETACLSPYAGCVPRAAEEGVSYAEAWFFIGAFHERDHWDEPVCFNRAVTAYREAIAAAERESSDVLPFARLALARTLFAQRKYRNAVQEAVALLDSKEIAAAPELAVRACQLVAAALNHVDLEGPSDGAAFVGLDEPTPPGHPYDDVFLTTEGERTAAALKTTAALHLSIARTADPSLVPQDRPCTPGILFWLAKDFRASGISPRAEIEADRLFLTRWPLHRDAPVVTADEIDALRSIATGPREPVAYKIAYKMLSDSVATAVASYASDSAWARANAADAGALEAARSVLEMAKQWLERDRARSVQPADGRP